MWTAGSVVVGLGAIVVLLFVLWRNANSLRDLAEQQSRVASSRQLAAEAGRALSSRLDSALLFAIAAGLTEPTTEAHRALLEGLQEDPRLSAYLWQGLSGVELIAFSPSGRVLASAGNDGAIVLWDLSTRTPLGKPLQASGTVTALAFSPDSQSLVSTHSDGDINVWTIAAQTPVPGFLGCTRGSIVWPSLPTAGRWSRGVSIWEPENGTVSLWDVEDRRPVGEPLRLDASRHSGTTGSRKLL